MNKTNKFLAPRRKRKGGTHKVGDLVLGFTRGKLVRGMQRGRALVAWSEVIGPALARTTNATGLRNGVMEIETQDAMMATTLTMQRQMFLDKLKEVLGEDAPHELRFHSGSIQPEDAVLEKPSLSVFHESEILAEANRLSQHAPATLQTPDLKNQVQKMAESIARVRRIRQLQGLKACPICQTICDSMGQPCLSCKVLMRDPHVRELSLRLARQPELALVNPENLFFGATEHSLLCAKFLALEYLGAKLEELALETVQTATRPEEMNELKNYLLVNAQAFLALKLKQKTSDKKDWVLLPANVRNVLESGL